MIRTRQAAVASPESVLLLGDRDKLDEYKNVDQQTTGVITPFNTETGALGKDLQKLFFVLRQRTAEEGTEFGRIVGGVYPWRNLAAGYNRPRPTTACRDCRCYTAGAKRLR